MRVQMANKKTCIAIEDLASNLGLSIEDVKLWIKRDKPVITLDHRHRHAIPIEFLDRYRSSEEYPEARRRYINEEIAQRKEDDLKINQRLKQKRLEFLDRYDYYIADLEHLHKSHLHDANSAGYESSIMAAYLLFSRVISTLKMACLCLRHGYWYYGSLIREIDESLNVAEYFIIGKDSPKVIQSRLKWFRQNKAPANQICREYISTRQTSIDPSYDKEYSKGLLNEVYHKKSKWTHPTYAVIHEITKYSANTKDAITVEQIEYGPCCYERKIHELGEFFLSSIWTSFQVFEICFSPTFLTKIEAKYLKDYDTHFMRQTDSNYSLIPPRPSQ